MSGDAARVLMAADVEGREGAATPWAVTWLTWPLLFVAACGWMTYAIRGRLDYGTAYAIFLGSTIAVLLALETLFPLQRRWKMTWRSFRRDLKYVAMGGVSITLINGAFGLLSIRLNTGRVGPMTDWPLYLSVPAILLVVDLLNYWQHRLSHELGGPVGRFLWRVHASHHLPDRVYVFMHAAGHPINLLVVRGFAMLVPFYFLGVPAEALLVFNVISNLQGLLSHCNVDIRAGWFNYVFVGTELHRFHHSAAREESKNYAAILSFLDLLFGTFYYRPGRVPERLGVEDPAEYPDSNEFWRVMVLPFRH